MTLVLALARPVAGLWSQLRLATDAVLRWALYEAAHAARRPGSPDRDYYLQAAEQLGGNRACLALARKLLKRCYHTLRELGDQALLPV